MLYEYEYELAGKHPVKLTWDILAGRDLERSIEHILPQTATGQYWTTRFHKADREHWTHDLGNLCLTQDNSSYGNKSFPEKRGVQGAVGVNGKPTTCYANSSLVQEQALALLEDWTPESVARRRATLLDWITRRWAIDESALTSISPAEDDEDESAIVLVG